MPQTQTQKRRIRRLIAALRSGEYRRTVNQLRYKDRFCPLGVACDIYSKATKTPWDLDKWFLGCEATLPCTVAEYYGFEDDDPLLANGSTVTHTNDKLSYSFSKMAGALERTFFPAKKKKGKVGK